MTGVASSEGFLVIFVAEHCQHFYTAPHSNNIVIIDNNKCSRWYWMCCTMYLGHSAVSNVTACPSVIRVPTLIFHMAMVRRRDGIGSATEEVSSP